MKFSNLNYHFFTLICFCCTLYASSSQCPFPAMPNVLSNVEDIFGNWIVVAKSQDTNVRLLVIENFPSETGRFVSFTFHNEDKSVTPHKCGQKVYIMKVTETNVLEAISDGPSVENQTRNEILVFSAKFIHYHVGSGKARHQERILTSYICIQSRSNLTPLCDANKSFAAVLANTFSPSSHGMAKSFEELPKACIKAKDMKAVLKAEPCEALIEKKQIFYHSHHHHHHHHHHEGISATQSQTESEVHDHDHDRSHHQSSSHKRLDDKFCPVDKIQYLRFNDVDWDNATGFFYLIAYLNSGTKYNPNYLRGRVTGPIIDDKWEAEYDEVDSNGNCNKIKLKEWMHPEDLTLMEYKLLSSSDSHEKRSNWEHGFTRLVYYNKSLDLSITYYCHKEYEGGACEKYDVEIFHGHSHVTNAHLHEINRQMKKLCVNPADLHYTVAEVDCPPSNPAAWKHHGHHLKEESEGSCKFSGFKAIENINLQLFKGVWHTILHSDADSYPFSAIVSNRKVSMKKIFPPRVESVFYGLLRNGTCEGPISAEWILDPEHPGTITLKTMALGQEITMKLKVIHSDPKFLVFIWCENGADDCDNPHFRVDSTLRTVKSSDLYRLKREHNKHSCPDPGEIAHMSTQSQCGHEIDTNHGNQRGYLAMKTRDSLHILTNHHEPQCKVAEIKGKYVDPEELTGVWFSPAYIHPQFNNIVASAWTAVRQSVNQLSLQEVVGVRENGKVKCNSFNATWTLTNRSADDYHYRIKYYMGEENPHEADLKFLFFNKKLMVTYNCKAPAVDGTCPPDKIVIWLGSKSQTIDPVEFSLLLKVVDSVCFDSSKLIHTAVHHKCIYQLVDPNAVTVAKDCRYGEIEGLNTAVGDNSQVGPWYVLAHRNTMGRLIDDTLTYRRITMFAEDENGVKSEFYHVRNGNCEGPTTSLIKREPNSATNAWSTVIQGEKMLWWDISISPQYWLLYACWPETAVCSPNNNSLIVLMGRHKKKDQTALQPMKQLIASKLCVHPKKLTWMNVAGNCGVKAGEVESCKWTDLKNKTDYLHDPNQLAAKWYLHAASWGKTSIVSVDIRPTTETHQFDIILHKKTENCTDGPATHGVFKHLHGCHYVNKNRIEGLNTTITYHTHMVQLTNETMILYNCNGVGGDGTCPATNTMVSIWSRKAHIEENAYEVLLAKLKSFCVDRTDMKKLNPSRCESKLKLNQPRMRLYE